MDLRLNEQQVMLRDSARRFLQDEYSFEARRSDLRQRAPGRWTEIAQLGWPSASLPEDFGGLGGSIVEHAILMEELGRALYVGPFLSTAICAAMLKLSKSTKTGELLSRIATGEFKGALAHGEPGARGYFDHPATIGVVGMRGAYTLTGRKRLVHDLSSADVVLVSARTDKGAALFLLEREAANAARHDYISIDNGRASDLELDGAAAELVAEGPDAERMLEEGFYWLAVGLGAEAVGLADGALSHTMEYVAVRKQFGRALADFQVIQHRLSDMFVELEQLRSLLLHAMSTHDGGTVERRRAAIGLKILAGQVAAKIAGDGLHLHGGMGMTDEMPISHFYRRSRVLEAQYGNSDYFLAQHARALS